MFRGANRAARFLFVGIATLILFLPLDAALALPCDIKNNAPPFIEHDLTANVSTSNSWCELCGYGYVTVIVANPYSGATMTNLTITENLGSSGLTYDPTAPTPIRYSVNGGALQNGTAPAISGPNGSVLTWTAAEIPALSSLTSSPGAGNNGDTVTIVVAVTRAAGLSQEGLVSANRGIQASVAFGTDSACTDSPQSVTDTLPLREPIPQVLKRGRNVDAAQGSGSYSTTVYGNINDDVIFRIEVRNNGLAAMQDLKFNDLMTSGNFSINYACPTEANATSVANNDGVNPGGTGCIAATNTINNFLVDDPFGNPGNDEPGAYVDAPANGSAYVYLVGKITSSCNANTTNTVSGVEWGCEVDAPDGGITQTSTGASAGTATATLSSLVVTNGLTVTQSVTGTNTGQPVGSKGTIRLTIRNLTGGTVKNINLRDVLPAEYVVDPTFTPTVSMNPAYGNYPGMTDNIVWTNPVAGTFPLTTTDPALPLANIAPEFTLTSTGCSVAPCGTADVHPDYPDQFNLMRHGDVLLVTFRIILIRPQSYDLVANLDVRVEAPNSDPAGTDPTHVTPLRNEVYTDFEEFCSPGTIRNPTTNPLVSTNIPANPEDIDVDITGSELIFILTNNPAQPLTLPVTVTNRGGHDARDYHVFVSFGATMQVQTAPAGCSAIALSGSPVQPAPWKVWVLPVPIPSTATVYHCTSPAVITPGQTVTLDFTVIKSSDPARIALDDLSFRADVVGEITLSNGTPLWFPTPVARADGQTDRANNYSLDGIRARVIGFNLLKSQVGTCTENNPPPASPDLQVQIGEECTFHIDTGGWFGFLTPGFTYIAVQDIRVDDQLPNGQGYISSTDPYATSTSAVRGITLNPLALAPLDEGTIYWTFNRVVPGERITVRDEWFRVDMDSRLLNDPIDTVAAPNQHAALSTNILVSTFQAVFFNANTGLEEVYNLGPGTVGYPTEAVRRISLTVTEPRILVSKAVCNEALYGVGTACSNFVPLANDGDARNSYIYRVTLTNEASSASVARAPAYDVTATDILDASDLAYVLPFASDGLDNDGDGLTDAADSNGEGTISDNTVKNGTPATLGFSHTHSNALLRINAGQSVTFYYRINFDDDAAPRQQFTNSVSATYDSLEGAFGNQSTPQRPNSDAGGARVYNSAAATSTVEIIPVLTQPKSITRLSNTTISGATPQAVSIGEEVEYQLVTSLPVALLRNFVIRDELPAGIRCSEAPAINLSAAPYSAAGFVPGGVVTPTCTNSLVEWNFGDQRVTQGTTNNRYDLAIRFIARVENSAGNNNGGVIRNGGTSTNVTARYVDQGSNTVTLTFGEAAIVVREPVIALTKAFSVANADASDVLTVTVTATNTGTATAYNLRVLDDLAAVANLTYLGNVSGLDPPDVVDITTLGANRPIFRWNAANPDYAIAPGASISFTFQVRVGSAVQPREILDNTIQASWASLPGQGTALNSTGLIGPDGSDTGLRNGALPNAGHPINDYETTVSTSVTVPAPTTSKADLAPATIPTIGAHKNFQIEILLPEGTSNNVTVSDNLAASGISYVLANNASYDISYSFVGISTINGQAPSETAFVAFPSDNTTGSALWNIGTVVTNSENDSATSAITPAIRISYYARVNNDLVTDAGDTLQNTVTVGYTHGETGAAQTITAAAPIVTVLEPRLTLAKVLSNVTSPGNPPVAGDILEYRVTATNAGTATAFDVNVVDTLPAGVVLNSGFTPTATINGVPVAGFVATPAGAPAGPLVWGRDNGDGSLDVPAGQTLILIYRTTLQVIVDPGGLIENGVLADWTSLNDANPLERTGAGCPTITAPNDYCVGPVTATTTGSRPVLRFEKTVFNVTTGQAQPAAPALLTATPGDTLRYRIRVQNISTTPLANFTLTDELDRLNALPMFVPGSLVLTSVPAGADSSNTSATGGAQGTGLIDVRNLTVGVAGANDTVIVEFEARLVPVIVNATVVRDQAQMLVAGVLLANSDDPILNGAENPGIVGDEDPTPVVITSAPVFRVLKTSQDLTGDPAVLNAGETLRYTITVKNIGTENATGVSLRDQIPANTTYVAGSTTLNGSAVADPAAGVSVLQDGFLIHAPEDPTPGAMRADATATTSNVATITIDVVINANVLNGTVISNQGFVNGSGSGGPVPEQPSDDPATPAANDPTRDVVGNLPLVYAQKIVQIQTDNGSPGIVDPGDVLRYTITITNSGAIPATGVVFTDTVPANTTYVADTVQLNGLPVGQPDGGVSPLNAGVPVSSSDLTPPLPGMGAGTLSAGGTATVIFDVQVNGGVPTGTIISNQGTITSVELLPQLTDADGTPANGYQPTLIVVGNAQALVITKQVAVVGGGAAELGSQLEYTVSVTNISTVAATNVVITDTLPAQLTYVAGSATLNGVTNGVSVVGATITADYATAYGNLAAGATAQLRFRADIVSGPIGTTITNTAQVSWNTPVQSASASASVDIGGIPGSGILNGRAWHDANFDNLFDSTELKLAGWSVQVYVNSTLLGSVLTDTNGLFTVSGLAPNSGTANQYEIRFRAPAAGASTARLGLADSVFTNNLQRISAIVVASGGNLQNLNLPIDPDGLVYNSILRSPVAGTTLVMLRAATQTSLPASCFDDAAQQGQVTLASGYYKFDLNFSDPSCPPGADYLIQATPPVANYMTGLSGVIPPATSAVTPPYSVPSCPADALAVPGGYCEAQASEFAPAASVPAQTPGTVYYLNVTLANGSIPGQSQLFNNHIPVDPKLDNAITIAKTSPLVNVTRGQLVPYTITIRNTLAVTLPYLTVIDSLPAGFKYVQGSAQYDGVALEPVQNGRAISWSNLQIAAGSQHSIRLLLIVGAGVSEGEYVNRARVINTATGGNASGEATATVRVIPDPTFDCTDIIGKVFDDANASGYQDRGEKGLAGVRVVSARGLIATTDKYGRYHLTCAVTPNETRGSNFILKLDDRSLPSGYRVTTENPLVKRATRGKMIKFNFGAGLHRVVRLDISDAVFEPKTSVMRPQWIPRIELLLGELKKSPSILRLSYLADVEDPAVAQRRLESVKREVAGLWKRANCCYALTIETETYWRRGAPPSRAGLAND